MNITFKILYNGAVAMTGGAGRGRRSARSALARKLTAEGVRRIIVCADDVSRYTGEDPLPEARSCLIATGSTKRSASCAGAGVSVLIYDQRCATESAPAAQTRQD